MQQASADKSVGSSPAHYTLLGKERSTASEGTSHSSAASARRADSPMSRRSSPGARRVAQGSDSSRASTRGSGMSTGNQQQALGSNDNDDFLYEVSDEERDRRAARGVVAQRAVRDNPGRRLGSYASSHSAGSASENRSTSSASQQSSSGRHSPDSEAALHLFPGIELGGIRSTSSASEHHPHDTGARPPPQPRGNMQGMQGSRGDPDKGKGAASDSQAHSQKQPSALSRQATGIAGPSAALPTRRAATPEGRTAPSGVQAGQKRGPPSTPSSSASTGGTPVRNRREKQQRKDSKDKSSRK